MSSDALIPIIYGLDVSKRENMSKRAKGDTLNWAGFIDPASNSEIFVKNIYTYMFNKNPFCVIPGLVLKMLKANYLLNPNNKENKYFVTNESIEEKIRYWNEYGEILSDNYKCFSIIINTRREKIITAINNVISVGSGRKKTIRFYKFKQTRTVSIPYSKFVTIKTILILLDEYRKYLESFLLTSRDKAISDHIKQMEEMIISRSIKYDGKEHIYNGIIE